MKKWVYIVLALVFSSLQSAKCQESAAEGEPVRWVTQARVCLYAPGDYGSKNWRIPAVAMMPDGTLLAVNDRRKNNEGDLPQDIDIVCRRSRDGGNTWTKPSYIIRGKGYKKGYGDPALVVCDNGDVLCAFCGCNGFWQSTAEDPERILICRSRNGGRRWSKPVDITSLVWGDKALNPACRDYKGGFIASGNGLRIEQGEHKGRLLFVAALCRKAEQVPDNFVLYSDDNGHTWQVSQLAYRGGDEAKVVELTDGRILMSVRQHGARGYVVSSDGGVSWGEQGTWPEMSTNACNGDIIRWKSAHAGTSRSLLLHSLPNSMNREKVSLFASSDEGLSWRLLKEVTPRPSAYSSMVQMGDGLLGIYYEIITDKGCELWFERLQWSE